MRPSLGQTTVLDALAPSPRDHVRQCLRRAALCSRLAKRVSRGDVRNKLYRLKHANIRAALRHSPRLVEIRVDNDRFAGLLSVRLRGANERVHTHENWIESA